MKQGKGQNAIRLVENLLIIYRDKFREPFGYLKDRLSMESITTTGRISSRGSVMVLAKKSEKSQSQVKSQANPGPSSKKCFLWTEEKPSCNVNLQNLGICFLSLNLQ